MDEEQRLRVEVVIREWRDLQLSTVPLDRDKTTDVIGRLYRAGGAKVPVVHFIENRTILPNGTPTGTQKIFNNSALGFAATLQNIRSKKPTLLREITERARRVTHVSAPAYGTTSQVVQPSRDVSSEAAIDACVKVLGFKFHENWPLWVEAHRNTGWARLVQDEHCWVVERPSLIKYDNDRLLHSEVGAALAWTGSKEEYWWHGTQVPGHWITNKFSGLDVDLAELFAWHNAEQRRAGFEIVGWDTVLQRLKATVVDRDENPEIGTLLEVRLPSPTGAVTARFCRVRCGTGREFALPVPNTVRTARGAQAWMRGIEERDYVVSEVRT